MKVTVQVSSDLQKTVLEEYQGWYGIKLTAKQLKEMLRADPVYTADLVENNFDTVNREGLSALVCKYIGLNKSWPLGMTSKKESIAFFKEFHKKAIDKGIELDKDFLQNYGVSDDDQS